MTEPTFKPRLLDAEKVQAWIGEYELALNEEKQRELPNRVSTLERVAKWIVLRALVGTIDSGRLDATPTIPKGRLVEWVNENKDTGHHADVECVPVDSLLEAIDSGELEG